MWSPISPTAGAARRTENIMLGGLVAGPTGAALGSFLLSDIKKHPFAVTYGECKRLMNMAERMKE